METFLTTDGRGVRQGLYAKSEKAVKARNQGARRILNDMLAIAPWLSESDRAALRAWCELEWLTRKVMLVLTQPDRPRRHAEMVRLNTGRSVPRRTPSAIGWG
jgi:hypothetical protein